MKSEELVAVLRGCRLIRDSLFDMKIKDVQCFMQNSSLKSACNGIQRTTKEYASKAALPNSFADSWMLFIPKYASTLFSIFWDERSASKKHTTQHTNDKTNKKQAQTFTSSSSQEDYRQYIDPISSDFDFDRYVRETMSIDSLDKQGNLKQRDTYKQSELTPGLKDNEVKSIVYDNQSLHERVEERPNTRRTDLTHGSSSDVHNGIKSPDHYISTPELSDRARERRVPGSRVARVMSFGGLAAGLSIGAAAEVTRRAFGMSDKAGGLNLSVFMSDQNAERIVNTLCRVRGAALKLGQMLSIQDTTMLSPQLVAIFERVRQSADFMPTKQMNTVLCSELGRDWRSKLMHFSDKPFAAASIGQVHKAKLKDGRDVAIKVQYPGVAQSMDSDIDNLTTILNVWNIIPKGFYIDSLIKVARVELKWEVDYIREAECMRKFTELVKDDPSLFIPAVIDELSTERILTTELVEGLPLDQCTNLDQESRNQICAAILQLCINEVFVYRFMQTDPNWANFIYNPDTRKIALLDFGATREYDSSFVDKYLEVCYHASLGDVQSVIRVSREMGFLTGYETKAMENAHANAVLILGEAFASVKPYDFSTQTSTERIHRLIPVMIEHRLTPPPTESYSLHRKLSGAFLLCAKLKAHVDCKTMFDKVLKQYGYKPKT